MFKMLQKEGMILGKGGGYDRGRLGSIFKVCPNC